MSVIGIVACGAMMLATMLAVWACTVIRAKQEMEKREGVAYWSGVEQGRKEGGNDAACERRKDLYTNEGMLVVAVHPDVAKAGVEALRGLTEKQMMGLICVANRIQNELMQAAMKTRDARDEMLDMARGAGAVLSAVRGARIGELEEREKSSEVPK